MARLDGKTAVVTGSTSGIGEGIAMALAREGAAVVVSGRRSDRGEGIVQRIVDSGGRAVFHQADLNDARECAPLCGRAVSEFGGLDILVNNVGVFPYVTMENTTIEQWDQIFNVNARAAFFCTQAAVTAIRTRGGGSIVNIGSTHPFSAGGGQFVYGISKGALHTMTRKLAILLAPEKIRVNWISVGWVLTEEERRARNVPDDDAEWIRLNQERIPMKEFTTIDDVAQATVYLCADSGQHVTGTDLGVNSGLSIHL